MELNLAVHSNKNLEEGILAHLLQNQHVDPITAKCQPWFFNNKCRENIYTIAYNQVVGMGAGTVDFNALIHHLQTLKKATNATVTYLTKLLNTPINNYPSPEYSLEELRKLAQRRRYLTITQQNFAKALNPVTDIDELMTDNEDALLSIEKSTGHQLQLITPENLLKERFKTISQSYRTKGIYTTWPNMDNRLAIGFAPGKLSIIAGRTSMGKSFFKSNLILRMARQHIGVMNICPEQGFNSEHNRLDSILSGINLTAISRLREWEKNDEKFRMLKKASETIATWNYTCVPTRNVTVAGVRTAIRRRKRMGYPVDIVFIDLFDRLEDVNVAKDRPGTISVKLNQIERIAEEEQVHFCLLVQINRAPEGRKDKRPTMGDLRDCGNFEQDADMILLLYREGYYDPQINDNILEVNMAKQRDGVAGVTLQFIITNKHTLAIEPAGEKALIIADETGE